MGGWQTKASHKESQGRKDFYWCNVTCQTRQLPSWLNHLNIFSSYAKEILQHFITCYNKTVRKESMNIQMTFVSMLHPKFSLRRHHCVNLICFSVLFRRFPSQWSTSLWWNQSLRLSEHKWKSKRSLSVLQWPNQRRKKRCLRFQDSSLFPPLSGHQNHTVKVKLRHGTIFFLPSLGFN